MAGANTLTFDDTNFDTEVLQSSVPVVVDFWAEWCGPCRLLAPVMDDLAQAYAGKAKVGKVNIDNAESIAARYGIQNIPTVLVFENGQPTERLVGAMPKKAYAQLLDAKTGAARS